VESFEKLGFFSRARDPDTRIGFLGPQDLNSNIGVLILGLALKRRLIICSVLGHSALFRARIRLCPHTKMCSASVDLEGLKLRTKLLGIPRRDKTVALLDQHSVDK